MKEDMTNFLNTDEKQTRERALLNKAKDDVMLCLAYLTMQDKADVREKYEKYHIDCASGALIVAAKSLYAICMRQQELLRRMRREIDQCLMSK